MANSGEPSTTARFELTASAPVRALAIAAGGAVLAMVMLILAAITDAVAALIVGVVVLVLVVTLAVVALLLTRRLRTSVVLDPDQITVTQGGRTQTLAWADVDEAGLRGPHLILAAKPGRGEDAAIRNPRTRSDPAFLAVVTAVRDRLDADRGYGARPFG